MKQILLICAVVALVGCGDGKEPLISDPIVEKAIRKNIKKPPKRLESRINGGCGCTDFSVPSKPKNIFKKEPS